MHDENNLVRMSKVQVRVEKDTKEGSRKEGAGTEWERGGKLWYILPWQTATPRVSRGPSVEGVDHNQPSLPSALFFADALNLRITRGLNHMEEVVLDWRFCWARQNGWTFFSFQMRGQDVCARWQQLDKNNTAPRGRWQRCLTVDELSPAAWFSIHDAPYRSSPHPNR